MRKFTLFFLLIGILSFSFQYASAQCGAGQTLNTYCFGQGLVNEVAFEVCPSAGMAAQADIVQGTFNTTFPAFIHFAFIISPTVARTQFNVQEQTSEFTQVRHQKPPKQRFEVAGRKPHPRNHGLQQTLGPKVRRIQSRG